MSVFRNILDKLIFNDEYENIDKNLTDSNVGGRKGRGIRDNLFVINAITNSVKSGDEEPCDVQVFDIEKCFDSLWVQECVNTLYENGFKNDKLVLLYEETKNAQIAIKTPNGNSLSKAPISDTYDQAFAIRFSIVSLIVPFSLIKSPRYFSFCESFISLSWTFSLGHWLHFFPICILLHFSADSVSLFSSMKELMVAFEISALLEHFDTQSTSSTIPRIGTSTLFLYL